MHYHFKVHKEGDGFWAQCIEIPGCVTQGDTRDELFKNMKDAINTCLEEVENSKVIAPLPEKNPKLTRSLVQVPVDPDVAFGFAVRYHRIKKGLTQKEAAKQMGIHNLYSYQRLEKRCNATLAMMSKIKAVYPTFSVDKLLR